MTHTMVLPDSASRMQLSACRTARRQYNSSDTKNHTMHNHTMHLEKINAKR